MSRPLSGGRTKALLLLSLSMVASAVAIMIVLGIVKRAEQKVADAQLPPDTVTAVVAARDLNVGVTIGPEDVVVANLIPSVLPENGVYTTVEELVGRTPRERVLANEVVREERLASADAGIGLNAIIEPGMRAMSVEVDSQSGVAGLIRPGNYVDVIVTIRPDSRDAQAKWVAHNFLQGAKVLAVGRSMGESEDKRVPEARPTTTREKPTVTIELAPDQAEALALATSKGDIHIVLRNDIDVTDVDTQGTYANAIIGLENAQAKTRTTTSRARVARRQAPAQPDRSVISEVIHGGSVEEVHFEEDGSKKRNGGGS
jgi:pilus assembly protein CpaB